MQHITPPFFGIIFMGSSICSSWEKNHRGYLGICKEDMYVSFLIFPYKNIIVINNQKHPKNLECLECLFNNCQLRGMDHNYWKLNINLKIYIFSSQKDYWKVFLLEFFFTFEILNNEKNNTDLKYTTISQKIEVSCFFF